MFRMCGQIDLRLRRLKSRTIFMVGLSRSGKSTLYNSINSVVLMGCPPQGSEELELLGIQEIDVCYKPFIENAEAAIANNGIESVTLLPNIVDKGEYTLADMGGFMDTRHYIDVIGISYVLKAAFQIVKQCQFVLVMKMEYFKNAPQLFKCINGFIKMFNFKMMTKQEKIRLLQSVTVTITKVSATAQVTAFARLLKKFSTQLNSPNYGALLDKEDLIYVLNYFSEHSQQIYLFAAAKLNQKAPPSTIVQDHFKERSYYKLAQENSQFKKQHKKDIFNLPFAGDFQRIPDPNDKLLLKKDIQNRIESYSVLAKILQNFFKKAIVTENLFKSDLSFQEQFNEMKKFNTQNDVYSKQFNNRIGTMGEKKFQTTFSPGDLKRPLKIGIKLAQNVFALYKLFCNWPQYKNEQDPSTLQKFMEDYKDHLVEIIQLFRNSFCSSYEEQQIILKFLFIAERGCREFSMLYQIKPDGKNDMCLKLKDSFESILEAQPFEVIQKKFVLELHKNLEKVNKKLVSDLQQTVQYIKYINELPNQINCYEIQDMEQYKVLKKNFLVIKGLHSQTSQQAILSLFDNLNQHKKTVQQAINKMNDEEDQNYPQQLNFQFINLLSSIANNLLQLQRADNLSEDNFAYGRADEFVDHTGQKIKLKLIIQQASTAMNIYMYCNDVESVCKAYEVILKNIPDTDYKMKIDYLKGMAKYCSKNCRFDQAVILYQKSLQVCAIGNLCNEYQKVKELLTDLYLKKDQRLREYFVGLKQKTIIDPSDDKMLERITEDLEDLFINPYREKLENQQINF